MHESLFRRPRMASNMTRTQVDDARDIMFCKKEKLPYVLPRGCNELSCMNFEGDSVPVSTYWICKTCVTAAPCAFELGYARRPQLYYSNAKPWNAAKRAEWSRSANTNVMRAFLFLNGNKTNDKRIDKK